METKTLELTQPSGVKQTWIIEASDWQKDNAHRIYFRIRLQGERYGEPRQAIWDVIAQVWMPARMRAVMLESFLETLFNLRPEPPTPTEASEAEQSAEQTPEAESSASTPKASSAWQFFPGEGYYQAETADGRKVRCNKDDFASIAAECEEAGIELTPELALSESYKGFYEVGNHGGARPGSGGGAGKGQGPAYQQGYQAGYKAGLRKASHSVVAISATVDTLLRMQDNDMSLVYTPGDKAPRWAARPEFERDVVVGSVQDFLDRLGYSSFDGMEDGDVVTVEIKLPA